MQSLGAASPSNVNQGKSTWGTSNVAGQGTNHRRILGIMWRYVLAWFPMVPIAVANGVVREFWYGRRLGELQAHRVSTLSALFLLGLYMWWVIRTWPPRSGTEAAAIGALWLGLTVAFEFVFGHYVAGHPWELLVQDYNLLAGRLWPLVPLGTAFALYLFFRLLAPRHQKGRAPGGEQPH
jgi:hypothetical protein